MFGEVLLINFFSLDGENQPQDLSLKPQTLFQKIEASKLAASFVVSHLGTLKLQCPCRINYHDIKPPMLVYTRMQQKFNKDVKQRTNANDHN